jgi:SAM-dependent methyltransferase
MTTLVAPVTTHTYRLPRPRPRPAPAARALPALDLPTVSFFGRTLTEYGQFFALNFDQLRGTDVLDVAAGPSSFIAEARLRKIDAVAVDPFYGAPVDELATQVERDYAHMIGQMQARARLFRLKAFPSLAAAEVDRRLAAQRFLADYAAHFIHGRYVSGALPRLPFFDRTFDLVLCAHLLFVYAARFDYEWHLAACRELVRVSAGEVRIHPLVGPDGRTYPKLATLRRELRESGIDSDVVAVNYEFFTGANSMLVLRRAAA